MMFVDLIKAYYRQHFSLDISSVLMPHELGLDENFAYGCAPSGDRFLRRLLSRLDISPSDRILDVGSGKGSAMSTMSMYPFSQIDGIEVSEALSIISRINLEKLKIRRFFIYTTNAVLFDNYANYNFLYFYNPFPSVVMMEVIEAINRQIARDAETIIIYNNPTCHEVLEKSGFVRMAIHPNRSRSGISLYSNDPQRSRLLLGSH